MQHCSLAPDAVGSSRPHLRGHVEHLLVVPRLAVEALGDLQGGQDLGAYNVEVFQEDSRDLLPLLPLLPFRSGTLDGLGDVVVVPGHDVIPGKARGVSYLVTVRHSLRVVPEHRVRYPELLRAAWIRVDAKHSVQIFVMSYIYLSTAALLHPLLYYPGDIYEALLER